MLVNSSLLMTLICSDVYNAISLSTEAATCGVCQGRFSSGYGGYACIDKTCDYVLHSTCATDTKVWDGIDVEGEEFEEAKDDAEAKDDVVSSLEEMDDNKKVDHFSHEHGLSRIHVDEECWQLCEACIHPIAVGTFLGCKECSFALHEEWVFTCSVCKQYTSGFIMYQCCQKDCGFKMDAKCASFTEPFKHSTHKCPLYLRLEDNTKSNLCCGCREDSTSTVATCTTCEDYYLDFKCLNLPPVVRFKYDTHPLYLYIDTEHYKKQLLESERPPPYSWRDVCEEEIHENLLFYVCFDCRTTLHVKCILGRYPYMEPGHTIKEKDVEIQIASNSGACSPKCRLCRSHCRDKLVFKDDDLCFCSYKCIPFYQIFNF
ncbi:hypothetical protein Bca52824_039068 [Brassica carinata]|uniref:DC1-like C-terminal domain-containing protein n=1 Tax=Brassica carinata TaxID=52824 RepID=A0A8X7RNK9_BRACI|nr:hypothetical protein Bca52824_039068 [Brassica carinata]